MAIPSRVEAAALLDSFAPEPRFLRHASSVAEIAAFIARRIEEAGVDVDRRLVEAAALLHDVDKLLPRDDPLLSLGHGEAGARWLVARGHPELSRAVANHPVTRLSDETHHRRWASFATREERIVAYSDKRAAQHLEPMATRFARWQDRHPEYGDRLLLARRRAERLERDVCAAAGIRPDQVGRLHWVRSALERSRRGPLRDGRGMDGG